MSVRVERDGRDGELPGERPVVQALDVGELVREAEPLRVHLPLGERVEHERVVGVRTVSQGDRLGGGHRAILFVGRRRRA
jgi:hypothetical protein